MFFSRNEDQKPQEIPSVTAVPALVDTSVIIDGRIVDIAQAGFAPGKLLVPRFVLAELQLIADSGDAMKRSRGRRGLEMLHTMRQAGVDMEIIEDDYSDIKEVDAKLVRLGRQLGCNVLTTDYNLNRVASIEGVRVLNINELANAVRPVVIPGEAMRTKIVQPGKEKGQGVGYLADGTMIVVDGGDKLIGQDVEVEITRVFQTVAGKMLFAILLKTLPSSGPAVSQSSERVSDRGNDRSADRSGGDRGKPRGNRQPKPNRDTRNRQPQAASGQASQQQSQNKPQNNSQNNSKNNSANGSSNAPSGNRRPKRVSPTQRLEDSLLEMTREPEAQSATPRDKN